MAGNHRLPCSGLDLRELDNIVRAARERRGESESWFDPDGWVGGGGARLMRALVRILLCTALLTVSQSAMAAGLEVVASFSILADMVKRVGGESVRVVTLVGPDQDSHSYRPTPEDLRTLANAKLVFTNGAGFEGWLERLIAASGFDGVLVEATKGLVLHPPAPLVDPHSGRPFGSVATVDEVDPHAWQDPRLGIEYVGNIERGFVAADPKGAPGYRRRGAAYRAEIEVIYAGLIRELNAVPEARRRIVVPHSGFGYLARAFKVTALAPGGIAGHGEISAARLAAFARHVRKGGVRAIFLEPTSNPRIVRQLARETGVPVAGVLYTDALSSPEGKAPTYLAMLKHNVETLIRVLKERR